MNASGLKANHPGIRNRYNQRVNEKYNQARIGPKMEKLTKMVAEFAKGNFALRDQIKKCYDILHKTTDEIRRGDVLWSPALQRLRDSTNYWLRVVRVRKGVNAMIIKLKQLANKIGNWSVWPVC